MVELVVGLQPNVACEFKRAGFLEWRRNWNTAADRVEIRRRLFAHVWTRTAPAALALTQAAAENLTATKHLTTEVEEPAPVNAPTCTMQNPLTHEQAASWPSRQCACLFRTFRKTAPF